MVATDLLARRGLGTLAGTQPVITCTRVAILVETIPTGGHTLSLLHQQGRPAGRALQPIGAGRALWLAGWLQARSEKQKKGSQISTQTSRRDPFLEVLGSRRMKYFSSHLRHSTHSCQWFGCFPYSKAFHPHSSPTVSLVPHLQRGTSAGRWRNQATQHWPLSLAVWLRSL